MDELLPSWPTCPGCRAPMELRSRGPAQAHLLPEFLCRNLQCNEFGTYRRMQQTAR